MRRGTFQADHTCNSKISSMTTIDGAWRWYGCAIFGKDPIKEWKTGYVKCHAWKPTARTHNEKDIQFTITGRRSLEYNNKLKNNHSSKTMYESVWKL